MFEPYRCESCVHGEYLSQNDCWDCSIDVSDDKEYEQKYVDDERM